MSYPGSPPHDDSNTLDPANPSPNHYPSVTSQQALYSTLSPGSPERRPLESYADQSLLPLFQPQPLPHRDFPPTLLPAPRLSLLQDACGGRSSTNSFRFSLAGSLDPATGIYYRMPERPRLRTAQACEKCRKRKAKCSGEHPCKRCVARDLQCEYAEEGRVRRRPKKVESAAGVISIPSLTTTAYSVDADLEQHGRTSSAPGSISSIEQGLLLSSYGDNRSKTQEHVYSEEGYPVSPPDSCPGPFHYIRSPSWATFAPMPQQLHPSTGFLPQKLCVMSSTSSPGQFSSSDSLASANLGPRECRASRPYSSNVTLNSPGQCPQSAMDIAYAQVGWTDQLGAEADSAVKYGQSMGFQGQQQDQYRHQRLTQEPLYQHQSFAQGRGDLLLLQHHLSQQPQSVQGGLHYPYQTQSIYPSPSLAMLSSQQQRQQRHRAGSGIGVRQTQHQTYTRAHYAQQDGAEHQHGIQPPHSQTFQDQMSSAMGWQGGYQGVAIRVSEQDLHPSLSRIERGNNSLSVGGPGDEDTAANYLPPVAWEGQEK